MRRLRLLLVLVTLSAASFPALGNEPCGERQTACRAPDAGTPPDGLALFGGFVSGLSNRARAIQVAIVLMCLALFILMKKFADTGPRPLNPKSDKGNPNPIRRTEKENPD
jgi:hypothetical protein